MASSVSTFFFSPPCLLTPCPDIDRVSLSSPLTVNTQSVGAASSSSGFSGVDGILGLGPVELTRQTVQGRYEVPTLSGTLYAERRVAWDAVGIAFVPYGQRDTTPSSEHAIGKQRRTDESDAGEEEGERSEKRASSGSAQGVEGAVTFGGYDRARFTGQLSWVPRSKASPAKVFWAVEQTLHYEGVQIMRSLPGILDIGTTLVYLASGEFLLRLCFSLTAYTSRAC